VSFQRLLTSDLGTRLWMSLGRTLRPGAAHALIRPAVGLVASLRNSRLYRALYYNQAYVLGPKATPAQVDANVHAVLAHGAQTSYDMVRFLAQGEAAVRQAIDFTDETWAHARQAQALGRGVMVCGCHLSAFNLGLLTFSLTGLPVQVLSRAQPTGGFKLMTDLRDRGLLVETPIDGPSLRAAFTRLRAGGLVATAADWPEAADPDVMLPFFGAPARLPTGHIRIALSTGAALFAISARWSPERGYYTISAPPLELERTGDRQQDVIHNARRVLAIMEGWIAETPQQWLMYYPVWRG